jgi:hypothetical protein
MKTTIGFAILAGLILALAIALGRVLWALHKLDRKLARLTKKP